MRIYLSGSMRDREVIRKYANALRKQGVTILSSWLDSNLDCDPLENPSLCKHYAAQDCDELRAADMLLYFSDNCSYGKNIEFGVALAQRIPIVMIGKPNSVFHYLDNIFKRCETFEEFLQWFEVHKEVLNILLPLNNNSD